MMIFPLLKKVKQKYSLIKNIEKIKKIFNSFLARSNINIHTYIIFK